MNLNINFKKITNRYYLGDFPVNGCKVYTNDNIISVTYNPEINYAREAYYNMLQTVEEAIERKKENDSYPIYFNLPSNQYRQEGQADFYYEDYSKIPEKNNMKGVLSFSKIKGKDKEFIEFIFNSTIKKDNENNYTFNIEEYIESAFEEDISNYNPVINYNPQYAYQGDAGIDLIANTRTFEKKFIEYGTGIAVEIPFGYVGLIYPRSSVTKKDLTLGNSVGVIDSNYRGEIKCRFDRQRNTEEIYNIGDKIVQLIIMPVPYVKMSEKENLSQTTRESGGFGSSGN